VIRFKRRQISITASCFGNVRLIGRCAIVQIVAILGIYRNDLLNYEQAAATHMSVTAPGYAPWVLNLFPGKEPADKRRMNYRIRSALNQLVEFAETLIVNQRYWYVLYDKLFRTIASSRDPTAIHCAGGGGSTVFQPNGKPGWTSRIEEREVFETVRYESCHLNQFVIIGGGIVLQLANGYFYRFLAQSIYDKTGD